MKAVEAVKYISGLFEAFVGSLATIDDLCVNSDVVVATMTEEDANSDVVFRR